MDPFKILLDGLLNIKELSDLQVSHDGLSEEDILEHKSFVEMLYYHYYNKLSTLNRDDCKLALDILKHYDLAIRFLKKLSYSNGKYKLEKIDPLRLKDTKYAAKLVNYEKSIIVILAKLINAEDRELVLNLISRIVFSLPVKYISFHLVIICEIILYAVPFNFDVPDALKYEYLNEIDQVAKYFLNLMPRRINLNLLISLLKSVDFGIVSVFDIFKYYSFNDFNDIISSDSLCQTDFDSSGLRRFFNRDLNDFMDNLSSCFVKLNHQLSYSDVNFIRPSELKNKELFESIKDYILPHFNENVGLIKIHVKFTVDVVRRVARFQNKNFSNYKLDSDEQLLLDNVNRSINSHISKVLHKLKTSKKALNFNIKAYIGHRDYSGNPFLDMILLVDYAELSYSSIDYDHDSRLRVIKDTIVNLFCDFDKNADLSSPTAEDIGIVRIYNQDCLISFSACQFGDCIFFPVGNKEKNYIIEAISMVYGYYSCFTVCNPFIPLVFNKASTLKYSFKGHNT